MHNTSGRDGEILNGRSAISSLAKRDPSRGWRKNLQLGRHSAALSHRRTELEEPTSVLPVLRGH